MIINIRGTSGSGKSTLVRKLRDLYSPCSVEVVHVEGRRQPLLYRYSSSGEELPMLSVIGHYETACGGCDTLPKMDLVDELVRQEAALGRVVLFEGLLISSEYKRALALSKDFPDFRIVELTTSIQECLDSVNARRRAKRGEDAPGVNPQNTASKFKGVMSTGKRLEAEGVKYYRASRDEAYELIKGWLDGTGE